MAKRAAMEELEASRGPGMSMRLEVRLIGSLVALIAVAAVETLRELEGLGP